MNVAVIGATGLVGQKMIQVLEEEQIKVDELIPYASSGKGRLVRAFGKEWDVVELCNENIDSRKIDVALFAAGGEASCKYVPYMAERGITCIDNSSYFRMKEGIPLVVPEVNMDVVKKDEKIIANPNCSTIQAVVAISPLAKRYNIKRIVYSTYQAVSGAGKAGIEDLKNTLAGGEAKKFPYSIANNCIPHIDDFLEDGYTKEEIKMIEETKKILNSKDLKITATTVRVPVQNCHSESINIEFSGKIDLDEIKDCLKNAPGVVLYDDVDNFIYPLATIADGQDKVYVGRIRRDYSVDNGINIWVVADNLRKGAASNAVQILKNIQNNI